MTCIILRATMLGLGLPQIRSPRILDREILDCADASQLRTGRSDSLRGSSGHTGVCEHKKSSVWEGWVVGIPFFKVIQFDILARFWWNSGEFLARSGEFWWNSGEILADFGRSELKHRRPKTKTPQPSHTPPDKKTGWNSFESAESGAGSQIPLPGRMAKARVKGVFFHRHRYDWAKEKHRRRSRTKHPVLWPTPFCRDLRHVVMT